MSVKGRPSLAAGLLALVLVVTACQRGGTPWGGGHVAVRVRDDRVPFLLLPRENDRLQGGEAHEGLVRVREEVDQGYLAVVPQRPVAVSGLPRFAWWRVDPRSGETTGVTDDGLHQAVELHIEHNKSTGETTITWREYVGTAVNLATTQTVVVATGGGEMGRFLGALLTVARHIREIVSGQ